MGRGAENIEKKKNTNRRKTLKDEEKEKRRIHGKSNKNDKHLWFYLSYKRLYFARKHSLKKVVHTITFCLQFLSVIGYLKRSNDTRKLNIHKYNNHNIIQYT